MSSRSRAIRNWKRLAGKAFIRFGEKEWPDPYEPISCIPNNIYRKRIKESSVTAKKSSSEEKHFTKK